jgi:hypothetical protein
LSSGQVPVAFWDGFQFGLIPSLASEEVLMKRVIPDGNKIASLRSSRGIKQISLAHDLGITDRQMRKIEKENASISN